MEKWWHGSPDDVSGWVKALLSEEAPRSYHLVDKREESAPRLETTFVAKRRRDSGILELSMSPRVRGISEEADTSEKPLIESVQNAARNEDTRTIEPLLETASFVSAEFVTSIGSTQANGPEIQVVGPGGRAVCYRLSNGALEGEVVIRRRGSDFSSQWKETTDILRRVTQFSSSAEKVNIFATYGYFELSKYELQVVMRPVFIFVIDGGLAQAHLSSWRQTVVEPATYSSDISDDEGLGAWSE